MKTIMFYLSILFGTLLSFNSAAEQEAEIFTDAELAQMLAPIALYPDSLLTHILIASTYPIEVIEAHRWLKKNNNVDTDQVSELTEVFDWDASVKALIPFERVLTRLSEDLSWTQALGDAFLQDETRLLQSIQVLRQQANIAGSLNKMDNMDISYEDNNIAIVPSEREVVYVPYYDSRMVYGSWGWSAYPPVYWQPYHHAYVSHYSPFYWHTGVHITFNYFFSAFHWHNRHVVVVNSHGSHHRYYHQRPHRLVVNGGYAKRWSHKPSHRKGVAYRTKKTSNKYHSKRVAVHGTNKQLNTSHKKFKQSLHASKQSPRKYTYKGTYKEKNKVSHKANNKGKHKGYNKAEQMKKSNNVKVRSGTKQYASQSKARSASAHKENKSLKTSKQTRKESSINKKVRKEQPKSNKRERSSVKNEKKGLVNKPSSHKVASTKRFYSNKVKERN